MTALSPESSQLNTLDGNYSPNSKTINATCSTLIATNSTTINTKHNPHSWKQWNHLGSLQNVLTMSTKRNNSFFGVSPPANGLRRGRVPHIPLHLKSLHLPDAPLQRPGIEVWNRLPMHVPSINLARNLPPVRRPRLLRITHSHLAGHHARPVPVPQTVIHNLLTIRRIGLALTRPAVGPAHGPRARHGQHE